MDNYTKELPNKIEFNVEWNYPVEVSPLSEDQVRRVETLIDPDFTQRKAAEGFFKDKFINRFIVTLKKFKVLRKINSAIEANLKNEEYPTDVVMLLLYEDSIKYCPVTFSEIATKLMLFIKNVEGKYLPLLRRNSMNLIVEKFSKSNPENATE